MHVEGLKPHHFAHLEELDMSFNLVKTQDLMLPVLNFT